MLDKLPGWAKSDAESVREEVQEWVGTTPEQRWHLAQLCARDALWAAHMSGQPERVLNYTEPLPKTTLTALARLRRQAGWGCDVSE